MLVSADSTWRPPPSAELSASFEALLAREIPDVAVPAQYVPSQCTASPTRSRFFDVPGRGRFAVGTSNAGYVVAAARGYGGFAVLTRERSKVTTFGALCYRPVAVFDLNAAECPRSSCAGRRARRGARQCSSSRRAAPGKRPWAALAAPPPERRTRGLTTSCRARARSWASLSDFFTPTGRFFLSNRSMLKSPWSVGVRVSS